VDAGSDTYDTFVAGAVTERATGMDVDLETDGVGLPVKPDQAGLTLELAIFVALFPHARGAFGGGLFSKYLRCGGLVCGGRGVDVLMGLPASASDQNLWCQILPDPTRSYISLWPVTACAWVHM
jgi:hypothetical protein